MVWPDVDYCDQSLRGRIHKPHDWDYKDSEVSSEVWCNGEAAPGIHDWSGPTIGDRECVRCGTRPQSWMGEACVSPLATTPPGKLAVLSDD